MYNKQFTMKILSCFLFSCSLIITLRVPIISKENLIFFNLSLGTLAGDWGWGIGVWVLGMGDWGLGIGDWGLGPIPNPQSPIPNPQSPFCELNRQNKTKYLSK